MKFADVILYSNLIYPGRGNCTFEGGVAIKKDKIICVGARNEIADYEGHETKVFHYENQLVMPGFIDSHIHISAGMQERCARLDLIKTTSKEECLTRTVQYYREHPELRYIYGYGWLINDWNDKTWPNKRDLDAVLPDVPVFLASADGWNCWVNSKGLEMLGYTKENITDKWEQYVFKDSDGELTGILYGDGCDATYFLTYSLPEEEAEAVASSVFDVFAENGITTVAELAAETHLRYEPKGYRIFKRLENKGKLNVRIHLYPAIGRNMDFSEHHKLQEEFGEGLVRISGLKMYMDGVINGCTAFMAEPYGDRADTIGAPMYTQEETNLNFEKANREGFAVRVHALGDGAVHRVLNAVEYSQRQGNPPMRNCIEHINFILDEDKWRFQELGVIAAIQPTHLTLHADSVESQFGSERWAKSFPFKSLLDAGAKVALSSDYPVVSVDPFFGIYAALTRKDVEKTIKRENPGEMVSLFEILEGYNYGSAYAISRENELGTLEAGKLADIVVIDGPLVGETPEDILTRKIDMTMFNGNIIYMKGANSDV